MIHYRWWATAWITSCLIVGTVEPRQTVAQAASARIQRAKSGSGGAEAFSGQARRGQKQYEISCVACHAADLTGLDPAPALTGEPFMQKWNGKTVWDLFDTIRKTMPQNDKGSLSASTYLDIVAYLAQFNNIDIGRQELRENPALLKRLTISNSKNHRARKP